MPTSFAFSSKKPLQGRLWKGCDTLPAVIPRALQRSYCICSNEDNIGISSCIEKKIFCLFQDIFLSKIFWSQRSKAIDSYLMHSFHFYRLCYVFYDATGSSSLAGRRRILLLVDEVQPLAENESAGRCVLWTTLSRQSACMENMVSWVYWAVELLPGCISTTS